jgi:spore maturation protein CgeB
VSKYKIILITSFKNPWNDGWYYKAGFENNGHTVFTFDPSVIKEPEQRIFDLVRDVSPDFVLHTKDELPAGIFQELRKKTAVIQWYPDVTIHEWLTQYVEAADIFFTMSEGLVDEFKKYNPRVFWLTQAFEPSCFQIKDITAQDTDAYSSDITFVGSLGIKRIYQARREFLKCIVKKGYSFKWWGPRLPRKFSTLPLILGRLGKAYGGRLVWGEEHAKIARLSKIYIAFDAMPHMRKSMSERMYIAVGCGAFYMCQHVEGIEEVLIPDKEIVTFRSEEEMIEKIDYYLDRDEERHVISEAGQQRVLKEHTYKIRINQMISLMENEDSDT